MRETKRSSVAALRRVIREAVSIDMADQLAAGLAKGIEPNIDSAVEQLMGAIVKKVDELEKHPKFGKYIMAFDFDGGDPELRSDLKATLMRAVDEMLDNYVQKRMSDAEDRYSNGETFSTGGYSAVWADRASYTGMRGIRER